MSDSENDQAMSASEVETDVEIRRPKRKRKAPAKLLEYQGHLQRESTRKVVVRCAQFGTFIHVKASDLSNLEGDAINESDFVAGTSLLVDVKGKSYPVTFVRLEDDDKENRRNGKKGRTVKAVGKDEKKEDSKTERRIEDLRRMQRLHEAKFIAERKMHTLPSSSDDEDGSLPLKKSRYEEQQEPRFPPKHTPKRTKDGSPRFKGSSYEDQPLFAAKENIPRETTEYMSLKKLERRMDKLDERTQKMEKYLERIVEMLEKGKVSEGGHAHVKEEGQASQESEEFMVGTVNLMRLSAATPYAFGLAVVDVLFTKEELASSLLFSSKKSPKPPLDPIKLIVNQKCRDSKVV